MKLSRGDILIFSVTMILFLCIVAKKKSERGKSTLGFNRMHQTLRRVKDCTRIPAGEQVTICWSLSSLHIHRDFAKKVNNDFGDKFGDKNNTVSSMIRRNKEIRKFGRHQNPQANVNVYGGLNDQKNETLKDQNPDSERHNRENTSDIQQVKYLVLEPGICCTLFL